MNRDAVSNDTIKNREAVLKTAGPHVRTAKSKVKFEIFGEEMIEKCVKLSGNSGRIYLPPTWVGRNVKIIRID